MNGSTSTDGHLPKDGRLTQTPQDTANSDNLGPRLGIATRIKIEEDVKHLTSQVSVALKSLQYGVPRVSWLGNRSGSASAGSWWAGRRLVCGHPNWKQGVDWWLVGLTCSLVTSIQAQEAQHSTWFPALFLGFRV